MFDGGAAAAAATIPCMVPLHLTSTTIHVAPHVADRLVEKGAAEWLPGVAALVVKPGAKVDVPEVAASR